MAGTDSCPRRKVTSMNVCELRGSLNPNSYVMRPENRLWTSHSIRFLKIHLNRCEAVRMMKASDRAADQPGEGRSFAKRGAGSANPKDRPCLSAAQRE